ncbi:MAG TPA: VTT domain-containing protein [Chitinophagaceae bacterium]|jgi:membrane-associated protein|nr:VTT domain-containing protein [Chitinophagaceae bacterium]
MHSIIEAYFLQGGFIDRFVNWIINYGGLYFLLFVIFAETGLFVGFFLPGDSLLFAAGIYLDNLARELAGLDENAAISFGIYHVIILIMIIIASILGNMVGYWFGYKTGPLLYERRETWIFKRKHLLKAQQFYHKYGKATIFLAKFLPIIRTFAPIVAGVVKMEKPVFIFYNIIGSLCWVSSMLLGGYFIDSWVEKKFGFSLKEHIEAITIGIILITTLPVLYKLFFGKHEETESSKT